MIEEYFNTRNKDIHIIKWILNEFKHNFGPSIPPFSSSKMKDIKQKHKNIISGYFRRISRKRKTTTIPPLISYLTVLYY